MSRKETDKWLNCAAVYVRMSTEHQQYSTSNQKDVICEYAKRRGLTAAKEYSDEGKSGLNIQGRDSLAQMIRDVQEGKAQFSHILVYDVSRWGRFQDADESAYYEYICKRAGVAVHYCAEQFENDGSPMSTVMKSMKRTMAGEYSRELSTKVFQGACRLIQLGYKQGGTAGLPSTHNWWSFEGNNALSFPNGISITSRFEKSTGMAMKVCRIHSKPGCRQGNNAKLALNIMIMFTSKIERQAA